MPALRVRADGAAALAGALASKRRTKSATLRLLASTRSMVSSCDQRRGIAAVPQCHDAYSASE